MARRAQRERWWRGRRAVAAAACATAVIAALVAPLAAQQTGPLSVPPPGQAATQQIPILKDVGIDQKLNAEIPLDTEFTDEHGATVRLGQYFGGRPVVLALVYYQCPMLCTLVLNGLVGSLDGIAFNAGEEYDVVVVSFDPAETPAMAAEKKDQFVRRYNRAGGDAHVHFLTGREAAIKALTGAVGFRYVYDESIKQWAHPAAITVLTGDGRVSRYLYGVEFAPRDLKLALVEAADGRIGSLVDQAVLFCYHYDPQTGKYGLVIMNFVRLAGAITVLAIGASIFFTLRRDKRQAKAAASAAHTGTR
jgi:protein SCO1/2